MAKSRYSLTRDHERQRIAYEAVEEPSGNRGGISNAVFKGYKILVNDLGAQIMRSGLGATLAFVERTKSQKARAHFLDILSRADLPHLRGVAAKELPSKVRCLPIDQYMLVTREVLKLATWLRRAVQARDALEKAPQGGEHAHGN